MIKIIGAVLILAGTAAWGIRGAVRLKARVVSLTALGASVGMMRSEICDRLTPTPEVFEFLANEAEYPAGALYKNALARMSEIGDKPFALIWKGALKGTPELCLNSAEEQTLSGLGLFFGQV